jgi:phage gpG-like protein
MPPNLQVVVDRVVQVLEAVAVLTGKQVLVGIPGTTAPRKTDPKQPGRQEPSNPTLGYIHEFGSPSRNIPARPFLRPGVEAVREEAAARLRKAGDLALAGKPEGVERQLKSAGLLAQNSVRRKITEGPFAPLAPATIAARKARKVTRTKPLIDTGQLRASITYVIRAR